MMHHAVGTPPFTVTLGTEPEGEAHVRIVGRERGVARVSLRRRPGAPEQPRPDATLVRDELVSEIASELEQLGRCLDPRGRRDRAVALRSRGEVGGVPRGGIERSVLGCGHAPIMTLGAVARPKRAAVPHCVLRSAAVDWLRAILLLRGALAAFFFVVGVVLLATGSTVFGVFALVVAIVNAVLIVVIARRARSS